MAKPLSPAGPQANIPRTGLSSEQDHYGLSIMSPKAQPTPKREAFAASPERMGRRMDASQPKPVKNGNPGAAAPLG
jgi:hypothetical protein